MRVRPALSARCLVRTAARSAEEAAAEPEDPLAALLALGCFEEEAQRKVASYPAPRSWYEVGKGWWEGRPAEKTLFGHQVPGFSPFQALDRGPAHFRGAVWSTLWQLNEILETGVLNE